MAIINPQVNFNGNCEEAFMFYRSVFGGDFSRIVRFRDLQGFGDIPGGAEADKIMNIVLPIGASALMGNDVPAILGRVNEQENRSKISVTAESREEAERLCTGLSAGGDVEVHEESNADGPYFAMFRDRYGIEWVVDFTPEPA